MKTLITKLSLSLMLLAFGSGLHAQINVEHTSVNFTTDSAVYGFYNQNTFMTVDFINGSSVTVPPNKFQIALGLPTGCEFGPTANIGPNWTYVYVNAKNAYLINNFDVYPLSSGNPSAYPTFIVPFRLVGPLPASSLENIIASVTIPMASGSLPPYYIIPNPTPTNVAKIVIGGIGLGVQFSSFLAVSKGCSNDISWSTAIEKGNDYFDVERSNDGKNFLSIARIPTKGNKNLMQNYSFVDDSPIKGTNYYRIRQTDLDKKTSFTTVRKVETNCTMADISIYPNPTYNVVYVKGLAVGQTVELYNALGQLVQKVDVKSETEVVNISKYTDGVYSIRVVKDNASIFTTKVVKR